MGNRIKRMQCLYQFREGQPKRHKPAANHAVIEQTPNTRGGYLIVFAAGLLTYPSLPRLPSPYDQWQVVATFCWNLQQQVLSRIFTGFPFHPIGSSDR